MTLLEGQLYSLDQKLCTKGSVDSYIRVKADSQKRVRADSINRVQDSHFREKHLTLFLELVDSANVLRVCNHKLTLHFYYSLQDPPMTSWYTVQFNTSRLVMYSRSLGEIASRLYTFLQ